MSNIIRVQKNSNYFVASNIPFNDTRLSWAARGVMAYLLSKPDGWVVRFVDLVEKGDLKRHAMRTALKQLQEHGYMVRQRIQNDKGKFEWTTIVYETPQLPIGQPLTDGTIGQSSTGGSLTHIVNTEEEVNTDLVLSSGEDEGQGENGKSHPRSKKEAGEKVVKYPKQKEMFEALATVTEANTKDRNVCSHLGKYARDLWDGGLQDPSFILMAYTRSPGNWYFDVYCSGLTVGPPTLFKITTTWPRAKDYYAQGGDLRDPDAGGGEELRSA